MTFPWPLEFPSNYQHSLSYLLGKRPAENLAGSIAGEVSVGLCICLLPQIYSLHMPLSC